MKKVGWEKWDWDTEEPKPTILSIERNRFLFMLGAWAGIGGLLGWAAKEFTILSNMMC